MSALECYPNEKLVGTDAFDYSTAEEHVKDALSKLAAKEVSAKTSNGTAGGDAAGGDAAGDDATNGDDESEEMKKQTERNAAKVKVGTLSKSEWDAVTLYMVFAFQKISEPS